MCILATVKTKQALYVKRHCASNQDYNIVSIQSEDIETEIIHELEAVGLSHSNQVVDVFENIFDVTDDFRLEKINEIHTFIFGIDSNLLSGTRSWKSRQSPKVVLLDIDFQI
ncbi:MAG: hypothetical protein EZS28_019457 [Streblomastix strix]|uniref:Uncharacterized protein n=1 Tax=Streblomastix strix TaxID=222440 RepID=A0A5J4VR69_9EUKA|nr:MAG: hypothetical protein EZS28_019457 [Streblomastix strix]